MFAGLGFWCGGLERKGGAAPLGASLRRIAENVVQASGVLGRMKNDAVEWTELSLPRSQLDGAARMRVTRRPALANTPGSEIDILGVVFIVEVRRQQPHDVHARYTAIIRQCANGLAVAEVSRTVLK